MKVIVGVSLAKGLATETVGSNVTRQYASSFIPTDETPRQKNMRCSPRAHLQSSRDRKHLGVRFREVCHVAAGWRCGRPRGSSQRQGRADTRARRPARPCPSLRREPLSLERLLFLTKAHTRASAPTIGCKRGRHPARPTSSGDYLITQQPFEHSSDSLCE